MQIAISHLKESLSQLYDVREAKAIISLLLEEVCGISRTEMILHPEHEISPDQRARLSAISVRLSTGEPVQYALGYEYFMGKKFFVDSSVLIPRPETAELVDWVAATSTNRQTAKILDVGTGSGCIALSLASLINNSFVIGADLSTLALKTARKNAENLGISNVEFIEMDILSCQDEVFQHSVVDKFDIIVSNPPYILEKEKAEMEKNVLDFEPEMALFVPDNDPLLFYRAIANYGKRNLREGGRIFFEINSALGKETCKLLEELGYCNIILKKDSFEKDRMIMASLLKKSCTLDEVFIKCANLCSKTEKCPDDLKVVFNKSALSKTEADSVIKRLFEEKYLDYGRFAHAYVHDQFRFNHRGKKQLALNLRLKHIPEEYISQAIEDVIDEEEYYRALVELVSKKCETYKDLPTEKKFLKVYRCVSSRGYEHQLFMKAWKDVTGKTYEDPFDEE